MYTFFFLSKSTLTTHMSPEGHIIKADPKLILSILLWYAGEKHLGERDRAREKERAYNETNGQ